MRKTAVLLALAAFSSAFGCIWDRDTLEGDMARLPGIAEVVVGYFDKNPPLYYEMRLERVLDELEERPNDLNLYDDASVALSRLHRNTEAIETIERKRERMEAIKSETDDDWYRYHANLGTFYAHRWLEEGAGDDLGDLRSAEAQLARAIEINPEAHFGREEYQLAAVRALIAHVEGDVGLKNSLKTIFQGGNDYAKHTEAREGITGLIVLGAGRDSVDLLAALRWAVQNIRGGAMGQLIEKRIEDLVLNHDARSLFTNATGQELLEELKSATPRGRTIHTPERATEIYESMLAAAEANEAARTEYMLARLERGEHPDSHPDFWNEFEPVPMPDVSPTLGESITLFFERHGYTVIVFGIVALLVTGVVVVLIRGIRALVRR